MHKEFDRCRTSNRLGPESNSQSEQDDQSYSQTRGQDIAESRIIIAVGHCLTKLGV